MRPFPKDPLPLRWRALLVDYTRGVHRKRPGAPPKGQATPGCYLRFGTERDQAALACLSFHWLCVFRLMRIESLRVKNFKVFGDVHLTDIPAMLVVVGANGTGKSTLFDVFSFLRDCLETDVRKALNKRGGFREVLSQEAEHELITFELTGRFDQQEETGNFSYELTITDPSRGRAIALEHLTQEFPQSGKKSTVYKLDKIGVAGIQMALDSTEELLNEKFKLVLGSTDILAVSIMGVVAGFPAAMGVFKLLTSFHLFNFDLNTAIGRKERNGDPEQLSESGDNLALVARTLYEQHPEVFAKVLERLARHVPGLAGVEPLVMQDGSLILRFQDGSFKAPFLDRQISDGTVKLFAYLVLLYDPRPRGLLAIDEPENHLYPKLMAELAEEFRYYAIRGGGQVLIATHSPDFLNATEVEEVCWLVKRNGRTEIRRAKDDQQVAVYMAEGDQMGYLWKQGFFKEADPQ